MRLQNSEIAQKFSQMADLLEIEGANPFRIRAYRNAARTVAEIPESVVDLVQEESDLTEYFGIGKDLASKIKEIVETNHLEVLDELEKHTPAVLRDLLKIPSLGPKKVQLLYKSFGIQSLEELQQILEDKRILEIRGFGEKTRLALLDELKKMKGAPPTRKLLFHAEETAEALLQHLRKSKQVQQAIVAGSYRRRKETVADLDVLATGKENTEIIEHFLKFDGIEKILSQGSTRSTVLLQHGFQVDLRVVENESYGAALLYFTGSKAHSIALRAIARKQGLKINEYGLFKKNQNLVSKSEVDIYKFLKLPYIEPELRENRGEIEAAQKNSLPRLIQLQDIKGDLHIHTKATDGKNTLVEMVEAAKEQGYSYMAITDHSKKLAMTKGLDEKRLLKQIEEIDQLNEQQKNFKILKGIEVDILEDGKLDLSDDVLSQLDFVMGAVHSAFDLSKEAQTKRILRAMENKYFKVLAHPTGRLIGEREAYNVDMKKIIQAAVKMNRVLEINSQPERMDLSDIYCRMAKDAGAKLVISTDSHSTLQLRFMKFGVDQARRGWIEKKDVINTLSLSDLQKQFLTK